MNLPQRLEQDYNKMSEFNWFKNNPDKLQIFKDYYSPQEIVDEILAISDPIYKEWVYYKESIDDQKSYYITKEDIGSLQELWMRFKKFWQIDTGIYVETEIMFDEMAVFSDDLLQEWRNMYCDNTLLNLNNKLELYSQFLDIWDFKYNSIEFMNRNYQVYDNNIQLLDEFSKRILKNNPEIYEKWKNYATTL